LGNNFCRDRVAPAEPVYAIRSCQSSQTALNASATLARNMKSPVSLEKASEPFSRWTAMDGVPCSASADGSAHLYIKSGAYYARWRTADGRQVNRKVGRARERGSTDGLTGTQAERRLRVMQQEEERRPPPVPDRPHTVTEAADSLRRRLALEGCRTSYLQNCESMQRIHIGPILGANALEASRQTD
jgi:hypothetical protein